MLFRLNGDGLSAYHVLLAQLIDLAGLENKPIAARGPNPPTDEDIEISMLNVLDCLLELTKLKGLKLDFNRAVAVKSNPSSANGAVSIKSKARKRNSRLSLSQ